MSFSSSSSSEGGDFECVACKKGVDTVFDKEAHMVEGGCLYGDDLDDEEDEVESSSADDEDSDGEDEDSSSGSSDDPSFGGVDVSLKRPRKKGNSLNIVSSKSKKCKPSVLDEEEDDCCSSLSSEEDIGFAEVTLPSSPPASSSSSSSDDDDDIGLVSIV